MNESEKQFSFTRAASSTSGRAKNQFPINKIPLNIGLFALASGACVGVQAMTLSITNIGIDAGNAQLLIQSDVGVTNQIEYCTDLSQGWWLALAKVVVTESPYSFLDLGAPFDSQRFYRARMVGPTPSGMVLIPAGPFTMGNCMDPSEAHTDELPVHTVYVSGFYLDRKPVTYSLWTNVYQWATNHGYSFDNAGAGKATNHPVQMVNWYDCVKWCNAQAEIGGLTPCYYTNSSFSQATIYRSGRFDLSSDWVSWGANGYRLPTEAEWEKAARGGATGHRFPWSSLDTITQARANYSCYWYEGHPRYPYDLNPTAGYDAKFAVDGYPYTSPAGYFAANGYGLYDMAGNVENWCWDWYDAFYYSSSPETDPRGSLSTTVYSRVSRGGSWYGYAYNARCAYRKVPGIKIFNSNCTGFRCVRGI